MKWMKVTLKRVFCSALVCLLCAGLCTSFAQAKDKNKVRVAVFPLGQFMSIDNEGTVSGYDIDYLNEIAKYTHWDYEYVICDNWAKAVELLDAGKVDMVSPAQKTDERTAKYDFGSFAMGMEFGAVYQLKSGSDVAYEDFDAMSGLTYGAMKGSPITENFKNNYLKTAGFDTKLKLYDDMHSLLDGLRAGEIDAAVTNIMFAADDLKLLGMFSPSQVYYMLQKNSPYTETLDSALTSINTSNPSYTSELLSAYFPIFNETDYTYQELQFLQKVKQKQKQDQMKIKVGIRADRTPLSYQDGDGNYKGIIIDVLDTLSKKTGLSFTYVTIPKDCEQAYLEKNEIYLVADVDYDEVVESGNESYSLTEPYLKAEQVFVGDKNLHFTVDSSLKLAVVENDASQEVYLKKLFPNFKIQTYPDVESCLGAVEKGEVDVLLENRYITESLLQKPTRSNLGVFPIQNCYNTLCVGVLQTGADSDIYKIVNDELFTSVLDKGIAQLSSAQVNNIIIKNTSENEYHYTILDFLYQYRVACVVIILLLMALAISAVAVIRMKQRSYVQIQKKNKQLGLAMEAANKGSEAKGRFLAQMSHEIRTPMNAIIGLTSIAHMNIKDPDKMEEYLTKIDGSSKILLGIINDVLDMSAIENNKLKLANEEFNFKELISSVTNIYYQQCKQKGIEFRLNLRHVSEEILKGDNLRVNQILLNLLSNAVKFTPSGGTITVDVVQTSITTDKVYMRFVVADSGCGMSQELKERLFKPFEQENATTAQKYGGSGLGLSICKNLVDMMNGQIQVESEKDVGTTFTADIPFGRVEQPQFQNKEVLETLHALVVDDQEDSCEYTGSLLERMGIAYEVTTKGEEALEMIGEAEDSDNPYSICIVDWKMPDMDGVEVTENIRNIFGDDTTVIIMSAYDLNEVEAEGRKAGADYFIPKPLFQSTLYSILMRISNGEFNRGENLTNVQHEYNLEGRRVLIAEDVVLNMEVAVQMLNMVGIQCECAENGKLAVEMFERSKPGYYDAILLDINMPVMDGYEAAKEIRQSLHEDAKLIPVYAMTANAFSEDVTRCLNAGMDGHIAKPIETKVLYGTLNEAINGEK